MLSSICYVLSTLTTAHLLFIHVIADDNKENSSNSKRKCFQCTMPYQCNLGLCYGDYCIKSLANDQYVSKGCENKTFRMVNGKSYMQQSLKFIDKSHCTMEYMFGIPNIICYCNDGDFCNRSEKLVQSLIIVILFYFFPIIFNFNF